jgi:hypothetical protein
MQAEQKATTGSSDLLGKTAESAAAVIKKAISRLEGISDEVVNSKVKEYREEEMAFYKDLLKRLEPDDAKANEIAEEDSFDEKSKILAEKSGMQVDKNTPHIMSEESEQKLSPFGELLRIQLNGAESHEETLKNFAEKYAELRDEIQNNKELGEDEKTQQLDELDKLFKTYLGNSAKAPLVPISEGPGLLTGWNAEDAKRNEAIIQHSEHIKSVLANLADNMQRHVDTFYDSFTTALKEKDFDTAFNESLELIKSSETSSYEDISYDDMQKIMDTMRNTAVEFDAAGIPTKYRYQSIEDAINAVLGDESLSEVIRSGLEE